MGTTNLSDANLIDTMEETGQWKTFKSLFSFYLSNTHFHHDAYMCVFGLSRRKAKSQIEKSVELENHFAA